MNILNNKDELVMSLVHYFVTEENSERHRCTPNEISGCSGT